MIRYTKWTSEILSSRDLGVASPFVVVVVWITKGIKRTRAKISVCVIVTPKGI